MNGFLIVALVCAVGVEPVDCRPEVAVDVVVRPAASRVLDACLAEGAALKAGGALGVSLPPKTYRTVRCAPQR